MISTENSKDKERRDSFDKASVQGAHKGVARDEVETMGKYQSVKCFQRSLDFILKVLKNL